jgi:hypothetical protein
VSSPAFLLAGQMDTLHIGPRIHSLPRNSSILAVLLGASLALSVNAQVFPTPNPIQPTRIKVSGRVVNSLTGDPLNRALVTVNGRETRVMLTGDDGSFAFDGVSSDSLFFSVRKPGFYESAHPRPVDPKEAQSVVLKMLPAATIVGRVLGTSEEPVEFANVQLYGQANMEGKKRWTPVNNAQTDEDGRFRFSGVRAGSYLVSVGPFDSRGFPGETSYASLYFPNAPDRRSATPVRISAGQQFEVDFNVSPVQVFNVIGKLVGPPIDGANIQVTNLSGGSVAIPAGFNPRTGMFQIRGLPRGTYVIRATGFQSGQNMIGPDQMLRGRATITVTSNRNDLVLTLHPPITIPINIRRENIEGGETQQLGGSNVNLRAKSVDDDNQEAYSTFEGPPEQGRLVLKGLDAGKYRIMATTYSNYYVASVTIGGTDILNEPLSIADSAPNSPIEVVVRNDIAKVDISIRGDAGPAVIVALPDRGESPQAVVGNCDQSGRCYMPSALAPGSYTFYAFTNVDDIEYSNRKALEAYSSRASHVTLSPNQTAEVTLDLIKTEP